MSEKEKKGSAPGKAYIFEQNLKRLEEIVKKLSDPQVPLMEGFALYEEGMEISRRMKHELHQVEEKVKILQKKGSDWSEEEFTPEQTNQEE